MCIRDRLRRSANGRLRLSVNRSNKNISVQLIDDIHGITLASASSLEKALGVVGNNNIAAATKIGAVIAERAKKAGVKRWKKKQRELESEWGTSKKRMY